MSDREVHLDMRTNENAELAMRVKTLEADVAALQRVVKAQGDLMQRAAEDVARLRAQR